MSRRMILALILAALATTGIQARGGADGFWERLQALCGGAFEGKVVEAPSGDTTFADKRLVMHVRECTPSEIRIPFHVGGDRSRTWVIARAATGLRLKHDHRHEDGSPDARTDYGGDTAPGSGTPGKQEFPADRHTSSLIPEAKTNVWTIEIGPGATFVYALRREGTDRRFRIEFDLSRRVAAPPPPWGADAPAKTPDITGQWDVAVEGRGTLRFALLVRKEDNRLIATLIAPKGEKRAATIEQAGHDVTIRFDLDNPGAPVKVVLTGTVDGRDIKGTADLGGKATAPWTAKKRY